MDGKFVYFEKNEIPEIFEDKLKDSDVYKCPRCGQILFIGNLVTGSYLEIWCKRCKTKLVFFLT